MKAAIQSVTWWSREETKGREIALGSIIIIIKAMLLMLLVLPGGAYSRRTAEEYKLHPANK